METLVARQPADSGLSWLEPLLGTAPFPCLTESDSRGFLVKSSELIPFPGLPLWTCFLPSFWIKSGWLSWGPSPREEEGGAFLLEHCRCHCLDVLAQLLGRPVGEFLCLV